MSPVRPAQSLDPAMKPLDADPPVESSGSVLGAAYESLVYFGGLALFGAMCLVCSTVATPLMHLLPRRFGAWLWRRVITGGFRSYLWFLGLSGIVRCNLEALDALAREPALIIAANHPSLIDVVLIAARLPNITCIIKADLWNQWIFRGSARLAGYICSDSKTRIIADAAAALHNGSQLLIFPEGTRTLDNELGPFKTGFALIAKRAGVPIQTVFIDINGPFLARGRRLGLRPRFPLVMSARLGERFEPPKEVRPFVERLECYCREELRHPAPPGAP